MLIRQTGRESVLPWVTMENCSDWSVGECVTESSSMWYSVVTLLLVEEIPAYTIRDAFGRDQREAKMTI